MAELAEYVRGEVARRDGEAPVIQIHYHAAPVEPPAPLAEQSRGEVVLINAAPYFLLLLGGVVILACVGTVTVLLLPALLTMVVMVAVVMGGFAVCTVAVAASVRSLRQSRTEAATARDAMKRSRRRR